MAATVALFCDGSRRLGMVAVTASREWDIKVHVENDNVLRISGEWTREEVEDVKEKYVRMERKVRKFRRKYTLQDNANLDSISGVCEDGVPTVSIAKVPLPEPKNPKTIEVKIG